MGLPGSTTLSRHGGFGGLTAAVLALMPAAVSAGAADKVYEPHVVAGETEFELRGGYQDVHADANPYQFVVDLGYGVNDRWLTEAVVKYDDVAPGGDGEITDLEWENIVVLTEPGQHWLDVGVFSELTYARDIDDVEVAIGPLLQTQVGREQFNLNLLAERIMDHDAHTELLYRGQWKHRGNAALEFGLQAFGELGEFGSLGERDAVEHQLGPALFGSASAGGHNKYEWNVALLAGLNRNAPDVAVRFAVEYEMY